MKAGQLYDGNDKEIKEISLLLTTDEGKALHDICVSFLETAKGSYLRRDKRLAKQLINSLPIF